MNKAKFITLDNGLTILIYTDKSKSTNHVELYTFLGGNHYEYVDCNGNTKKIKPGTAHLLEHYVFENTIDGDLFDNLKKYNPDILVITGHDAYYRKKRSGNNYKNTSNFVLAVKEARKYESSHEKLFIIAGACQSNYEELIKAGANFASSPKRINIHALDPAIIAACLAFSDKNNNIDLIKILAKTKYGADGIGGIITKGTMYIGYPR